MTGFLLPLLLASAPTHSLALPKALRVQMATAPLGFSGATLSIRNVQRGSLREAVRTLILKLPSGKVRAMRLDRKGGFSGGSGLNLYHVRQDLFRLIGPHDCVSIEAIRGAATRCNRARGCAGPRAFIGRYDWMNGFDAPHGRFGFRFRFLPHYDAAESLVC